MDGWMDEWTDGRTDGQTNGRTDEWFVFLMVFEGERKAMDGSFDFDVLF